MKEGLGVGVEGRGGLVNDRLQIYEKEGIPNLPVVDIILYLYLYSFARMTASQFQHQSALQILCICNSILFSSICLVQILHDDKQKDDFHWIAGWHTQNGWKKH